MTTTTNSISIRINLEEISKLPQLINYLNEQKLTYQLLQPKIKPYSIPNITHTSGLKIKWDKQFGRKGLEILKLLAEGATYIEISSTLEMTINGVRYYIKKIYRALGVTNCRDAVRVYLTEIINQI